MSLRIKMVFFLSFAYMLVACSKSETNTSSTNTTPATTTTTTTTTSVTASDVTFNNYIKNKILTTCLSCHGGRGGVTYTGTYSDLISKKAAFNKVIQDGSMPEGSPFSTADRALVQAWIDRGAPEN